MYAVKTLLLLAATPYLTFANEYPKGHRALEIFDAEGIAATPSHVMLWIYVSTACFAAGIFFVKRHKIARWVVGCYIAGFLSLVVSSVFNRVELQLGGFNSLMHLVFWTPALYKLLSERPFLDKNINAFSIWSGIITAVMLISYYFDIPYTIIFLGHIFLKS